MSFIAENLICTTLERRLRGTKREEQVSFYKDRSGEVEFVFKGFNTIIPIEVKWRNDMPSLKTLQKKVHEKHLQGVTRVLIFTSYGRL